MKKVILTALTSLAAVAAFAQGTVTFLNDTGTLTTPPDRFIRFASGATPGNSFGTAGAPAFGTNFAVQLYYGASSATEASFIPVTSAPSKLRASTSAGIGTWSAGGSRTLNFAPGTTVQLQVRVWDLNAGATYESTFALGIGTGGSSTAFLYTIPQPSDPGSAFNMANFAAFTINAVPEPTTFALAGLGAAALLIFRRRK